MEHYESLGLVGEGSYGTVLKCRHRDSGRLVAIKKFMDSDDDKTQLRHDNLVNLLDVFKRRRRWYLVFEFVERTLLDDLEQNPTGLDLSTSRLYLYQVLRAAAFCHRHHIIHRDIKPENILISQGGVVKLCDFGFARTMKSPTEEGVYTDYVATRWYRAPELLVGNTKYGKAVDVWAVGCLLMEMFTGQPLFPGESDLDQIYLIVRCFGNLTAHHQELFYRNPAFSGVRLPECFVTVPLEQRFPTVTATAMDLAQCCLQMDPERRAQCSELLEHPLFTQDSFHTRILDELDAKIQKDQRQNSTLPKIFKTSRPEKDEEDVKNQRVKDKKQSEDMDERVNKEKEKRDKQGEGEKIPKTKGKKPSKQPKTLWNTTEPLTSSKQFKMSGAKITDNAAKTTVAMRNKPGKTVGVELRKEPEISNSDSLDACKTAKDRDPTGLRSSCSDDTESSVTEKTQIEMWRSSKSEPSQDFGTSGNNSNSTVPKLCKSSTTDHPNGNSSPKASLNSTIDPAHSKLTQKICITEYPEDAARAVTSETLNIDQEETSSILKVSQPSINDHTEVTTPTIPSFAKLCQTTTMSEPPTDHSDMGTEQKKTSERPKVLPLNLKPYKTTSISGSKITKNTMSKTLTSDQSSTVFKKAIPAHSTKTLLKGTLQTGSSKPTSDATCVPNKLCVGLSTDRELTEACLATKSATKSEQDSCNHTEVTNASDGHFKGNPEPSDPCSIHLQTASKSKINTESQRTSTSVTSETPNTNMSVGITIPKTLKASVKENREDLVLSVSISATSTSLVDHTSSVSRSSSTEQQSNHSEAEPVMKSLKPSHCKSLTGEPKTKLRSSSIDDKSASTSQKNRFSTEARKKRGNPERNNRTSGSTTADLTSFTSTDHSMDTADINEFDFSSPHSSPPPPPPPPSSTPLLLLPTSTSHVPFFSAVSTNSPVPSDPLTLGAGFHPGTHSLRCADKPRHHDGIRLAQRNLSNHITGSLAAQLSEKSLTRECSFLSDCCNHGNSDGVTAAKKKPEIHLPVLRGPVLLELRGREGKQTKGASREGRKDKQQHRHSRTDSH
uniref:cyclin-dependent kinase-like 5 isoform X2 n=1 Tax=Scatophagus argus TaxID=75038 RepID=UPI001ED80976|nr:cyclin-dependent kinase-like 5 isoform X2 [Scatophagus argus]